jgi:nitrogen fixation protein FixH
VRTAGILANQGRKQKVRGWRGRENGIPEANSKVAKRKAQSEDGEKGKISYLNKHAMIRSVQKRGGRPRAAHLAFECLRKPENVYKERSRE